MSAPPEMWEAFIGHLEGMVEERTKMLAALDNGMHITKNHVDITKEWGEQIEREIASIRNTINRMRNEYAQRS